MTGAPDLWAALPVPALVIDGDDRITECNPAAENFLNLSRRALLGQRLWAQLREAGSLEGQAARARAQGHQLVVNDIALGSATRRPVPCNLQIVPLADGAPGARLMTIGPRDPAGRVDVRNGPAKAARTAIGMAEMLAHEIKNPLAGITGSAQLLSMSLCPDEQELTDLIVAECKRVVTLLDRVEQFGNLQPPRRVAVNLHDAVMRARVSAGLGVASHMEIVEDFDPSLPEACVDPDQLVQVLLNLLKNASEASPGGGRIIIRTFYERSLRLRKGEGHDVSLPLQIEVIDNGPGLPADLAEDIFEPFVSGRENGTGLGLALVSKLMSDNGGWVQVQSRPGETCFRLSLPRAQAGGPAADAPPPPPRPNGD